jgi:hypothetical protein
MDSVGYIFIFALGAFTGSLATSWANLLCKQAIREEKQEQEIIKSIDEYM